MADPGGAARLRALRRTGFGLGHERQREPRRPGPCPRRRIHLMPPLAPTSPVGPSGDDDAGYSTQHRTRPQTVGYAQTDSPGGWRARSNAATSSARRPAARSSRTRCSGPHATRRPRGSGTSATGASPSAEATSPPSSDRTPSRPSSPTSSRSSADSAPTGAARRLRLARAPGQQLGTCARRAKR
jgi:hypothetical protein